jgi:hypothetical protein
MDLSLGLFKVPPEDSKAFFGLSFFPSRQKCLSLFAGYASGRNRANEEAYLTVEESPKQRPQAHMLMSPVVYLSPRIS